MEENIMYSHILSMLLHKIEVPEDFHGQVKAIKTMLSDDISGLVDSLTDFAVDSATVDFQIETSNPTFSELLKKWLDTVNKDYRGQIPSGIKSLAKEYFMERWKYSSFPVLKIAEWSEVNGVVMPTKMYFLDGGSIYANDKYAEESNLKLINYDYYIGNKFEPQYKLSKNVIFSRPYGRWFDKYPKPYLIKRGVYHNWKIISSIKAKQLEILNQVIPYILLVKKGTEALAVNSVKTYNNAELQQVITQMKTLFQEIKKNPSNIPVRVTQFDEEIKHFIPDLGAIFKDELFANAEKNILAGLGFIDIAEAVSTSRRESILNPKAFVEEVNTGVADFKQLLKDLILLIIDTNQELHPKYTSHTFYVTSSPVKTFMTEKFKTQLRMVWKDGQMSNQTYCEMVGDVEYKTEKARREKEVNNGDEILMYPHITDNRENDISPEEEKRHTKYPENIDKNGKEIPIDKTDKNLKEDFDISKNILEGAPYKNVKELPKAVKSNMPIDLQRVFMRVFNRTFESYNNDIRATRVAWSVIKQIARKNSKGVWTRKRKRVEGKLKPIVASKEILEKAIAKEEKETINDTLSIAKLKNEAKKSRLLDKLLHEKNESKDK